MISGISVLGVTVGTMALIIVLSVFNGFESLIISLFNSFNPDIEVTVKRGKTFNLSEFPVDELRNMPGVYAITEVVEENALLRYRNNQYLATIRGVSDDIMLTSGLDTMLIEGSFRLYDQGMPRMVMGAGVAYYLNASLHDLLHPVTVYLPRREGAVGISLERAFNSRSIFPSAVFSIQQDFDTRYAIVPISFARELLDYTDEVTSLEIAVAKGFRVDRVKSDIIRLIGDDFHVKNRFEQQVMLYRIMKSEKWAIYFILTFILIIAAFNVISSLTMLILDKKDDIAVLHSMGAGSTLIKRIFLFEGMMISIGGALLGLFFGGLISWIQQQFGIITLGSQAGAFVISAYPVELKWGDFFIVFVTVIVIGLAVAWYPVRQISRRYLRQKL